MGSFTHNDQIRLDEVLERRNTVHAVHHNHKAKARKSIEPPGIHESKSSALATVLLLLTRILRC